VRTISGSGQQQNHTAQHSTAQQQKKSSGTGVGGGKAHLDVVHGGGGRKLERVDLVAKLKLQRVPPRGGEVGNTCNRRAEAEEELWGEGGASEGERALILS